LKAIVFANGEFEAPPDLAARIAAAALLIAADGGLGHLQLLDLQPDVVVGDLDSVDAAEAAALEEAGVQVLRHPADKDQTDLELALLAARQRGADAVEVLGGLGRRWDHSLANVLMTALPELSELPITFLHGEQRLFLIREVAEFEAQAGSRVSLIPVAGDAIGVRTVGLLYPLASERLVFGGSRGVSNVMAAERAQVELDEGLLLCVISPYELE